MKLIKINTDHYVVVDDSEIKEGDWCIHNGELKQAIGDVVEFAKKYSVKITHSTQPLEKVEWGWGKLGYIKIQELSLQEVKELIGDVNMEKKAEESVEDDFFTNISERQKHKNRFIEGYNQALEDNKKKKYTEKEVRRIFQLGVEYGHRMGYKGLEHEDTVIKSLKPKTEWEVEIVDGKLKLKS